MEAAHAAIRALNGTVLRGHTLAVQSADTDNEYERPNDNLYMVNVPLEWDEKRVRQASSFFFFVSRAPGGRAAAQRGLCRC